MRRFLSKQWFLLLLAAGLTLAWLDPHFLEAFTRQVSPMMVIAPAFFLMALGLESRSLYLVLVRPFPALWALTISYGFVPAMGWLLGQWQPNMDLRIGLMIVASVPCTLASAVIWTRMAGGSEATALLVTLLSTCTSWLATTAWLALATGTQVQVDSRKMMEGLLVGLVLPVGLGQALRLIDPLARTATRHKILLGVASRLLVLAIILKAGVACSFKLAEEMPGLGTGLFLAVVLALGTHLLALAGGFLTSKLWGFDRASQIAVAIAGSQKTLPVALYLLETYYRGYPFAVIAILLYHVGQLVADTFIAQRLAETPVEPAPAAV